MTSRDPFPFGKYKGQPIETIPPEYRDWCRKQDWFLPKFANIDACWKGGAVATAQSTPEERETLEESDRLLNSMSTPFQLWWARAYGERLRKLGELNYIPMLRVAIAAYTEAERLHATNHGGATTGSSKPSLPQAPTPQPDSPSAQRTKDLAALGIKDEDIPF